MKADFICELDRPALRDFNAIKLLCVYPNRAVLFAEQEQPRGVFVLYEGRIKLSMGSEEGRSLILQVVGPGEVLGLTAVLSGLPYEVTAETLRPSRVAFVRRDDFLNFIGNHPYIYRNLLEHIASSYHRVRSQFRILGLSPTAQMRLARVLLSWLEETEEADARIQMPLTQEEIGEFIGFARETVTRTFADFRDRHLITMRGAWVSIRNRKALEAIAAAQRVLGRGLSLNQ